MSINIHCINWSPFIYGKTYYSDYKSFPLVIPEDFSKEKAKWVLDHIREINGAISIQDFSPSKELVQRLFLSDDEHYIFGTLCNLEKLLTEDYRQELVEKYIQDLNNERAQKLTVDSANRQIPYTFLAYVIKKKDISELPAIRFELNIFAPLCKYLYQKWLEERPSQTILPYQEESFERFINSEANTYNLPELNCDPKKLALHPGAELDAQRLWTAASLYKKNQTLWIGQLPQNSKHIESIKISALPEKTISQSKFLNISLPNIDNPILVSKQMDSYALAPKKPEIESESSEGDNNQINNLFNSGAKFVQGEFSKLDRALSYLLPPSNIEQPNFEEIKRRLKNIEKKAKDIENQGYEFKKQIESLQKDVSELREDISEIENSYQDYEHWD